MSEMPCAHTASQTTIGGSRRTLRRWRAAPGNRRQDLSPCVGCDLLIAQGPELSEVIASSGVAGESNPPWYVVLGTVDRGAWRQGLVRTVTLADVRECMADFSEYLRVDVTHGEWKDTRRA
jgi:hypothetical protein